MKIKVAHLLRRVENIDRDLDELETLRNTLQEDRAYSQRVRDSLTEESLRLRTLRSRILGLVIRQPPAELIAATELLSAQPPSEPQLETSVTASEIEADSSSKGGVQTATEPSSTSAPRRGETKKRTSPISSGTNGNTKEDRFKFVFQLPQK